MTAKKFVKAYETQLNRAKTMATMILGLGFMNPEDFFKIDFSFTMFKAFIQNVKEGKADPAKNLIFSQRLTELQNHLNKLAKEIEKTEGAGPYLEFTKAVGCDHFKG